MPYFTFHSVLLSKGTPARICGRAKCPPPLRQGVLVTTISRLLSVVARSAWATRYYLKPYRWPGRRPDGGWALRGAASADARRAILPRKLESSGSVKNTLHRRPR